MSFCWIKVDIFFHIVFLVLYGWFQMMPTSQLSMIK
jgi:hypothetical protein